MRAGFRMHALRLSLPAVTARFHRIEPDCTIRLATKNDSLRRALSRLRNGRCNSAPRLSQMSTRPGEAMPDGVVSVTIPGLAPAPTRHKQLIAWVARMAALTKPHKVHWCDASQAKWVHLTDELVAAGNLTPLLPARPANSI